MTDKILAFLKENGYVNPRNESALRYGIHKTGGILIDLSVAVLVGCLLGIGLESALFWTVLFFQRIYVGGYHAGKERTCVIISFAATVLSLLFLSTGWESPLFLCLTIILGCIDYVCAPVEAANKPLSEKERQIFGRNGRWITLSCLGIIVLGYSLGWKKVYMPIAVSVVVTGIGVIAGKMAGKKISKA